MRCASGSGRSPSEADDSQSRGVARSSVVLVMVLLVVASNVATLVFARTWSRAPELAVRTALGAARTPRRRSAVPGDVAARLDRGRHRVGRRVRRRFAGSRARSRAGRSASRSSRIRASWLFVVLLTLLVSAVSGLLPALRVTRHDLRNTLYGRPRFRIWRIRPGRRAPARRRDRVVGGAAQRRRDDGARVQRVLRRDPGAAEEPDSDRAARPHSDHRKFAIAVVAAARELPGVIAAGAGQQLPRLYPPPRPTAVEPIGDEPAMAPQPAPGHAVGHGFMEAIGAHAIAGRLFNADDFVEGAAPVAIVNEPFVRSFLAAATRLAAASASTIRRRGLIDDDPRDARTTATVARDRRRRAGSRIERGDPALAAGFYLPVRDEMLWYLAIRTTADPLTLAPPLRVAVANIDPDLQLEEIRTLEDRGSGGARVPLRCCNRADARWAAWR